MLLITSNDDKFYSFFDSIFRSTRRYVWCYFL